MKSIMMGSSPFDVMRSWSCELREVESKLRSKGLINARVSWVTARLPDESILRQCGLLSGFHTAKTQTGVAPDRARAHRRRGVLFVFPYRHVTPRMHNFSHGQ